MTSVKEQHIQRKRLIMMRLTKNEMVCCVPCNVEEFDSK